MSGLLGSALQGGSVLVGLAQPFGSLISSALGPDNPIAGLLSKPRSIGTIIPDVTIEENFSDRVQVTQHPMATGAPINDHVYRLPRTITMRCGWTNAAPITAAFQGFMSGGGLSDLGGALEGAGKGLLSSFTEQRAKGIYDQLLKLQYDPTSRTDPVLPFNLTAGNRTYQNVVITEISVRNNHETEYALIAEIRLEVLNIVSATVSSQPGSGAQALPSKTAPTADGGTKQATPTSWFRNLYSPPTPGQAPGPAL